MTVTVALYARISEDELGTEKGVTRQLEDARALARARGWTVVGEYVDNDVSATKGAPRPGYADLMAGAAARAFTRIVVFHTSRLWRNRRERADAIELLKGSKVGVVAVKGPDLDLSTASGRMLAGILGEFDTAESEIKGERVARAAEQRAREGRANGAVLYGWRREYIVDDAGRVTGFQDVEDPEQASIVREIVDRLLAGDSLRGITEDLNRRGVPGPNVATWGKTSVKKIALRPANVGLRLHHRGRPDEALLPAAWPAIVDRGRHDQVVALLTDPERSVRRPAARQHLLSGGIGECGVCGGVLRVALRGNAIHGTKQRLYVCDAKGCVGRNRDRVDERVEAFIAELCKRSDAADLLQGGTDDEEAQARDRVQALRARLDRAADDYAEEKIDADQLGRITSKLKPKLDAAKAELRQFRRSPHAALVHEMADGDAAEVWARSDVNARRAALEAIGARVVILPVTRRGPGFDPRSVRIEPLRAPRPAARRADSVHAPVVGST